MILTATAKFPDIKAGHFNRSYECDSASIGLIQNSRS